MVSSKLLKRILSEYTLPWSGFHGVTHWGRVFENGARLAEQTGAHLGVVQLFAVLHDSRRLNEGWDEGHGRRGAKLAVRLRDEFFRLSDSEFDLLYTACAEHTDGKTEADVTIQTCWDADRLDLGRVGMRPDPQFLCTAAAKCPEMIRWADGRGQMGFVPEIVRSWNLERRFVEPKRASS